VEPKFPGILYAILLVIAVVGLQVALTVPVVVAGLFTKTQPYRHPGCLIIINLLAFGAVSAWGVWKRRSNAAEVFPMRSVPLAVFVSAAISLFGLAIVLSEVDNLVRWLRMPPEWFARAMADFTQSETSPWGSFLALVVVAPVTEELFFRGLILGGFLSRYSVLKSVVVSSLLFGAIHLNPWQFATASLLGAIFAWWFLRTRSLRICLFGHAVANLLVFCHADLPFKVRGFNDGDPLSPVAVFQPWWFDLIGLTVTAVGCWCFVRATRALPEPSAPEK